MIGAIDVKSKSAYNPSDDVKNLTSEVKRDYATGIDILNTPYLELNDRSVIDDQNVGQLMMNAFVDTTVEDPREGWKWRGTRSKARNKAIAMVANLAGNILIPSYTAQNDADEVDRDFSEIMRDGIEWMTGPDVSNYQSSFLQAVFGIMSNPVTYLGAEFCEVFQTIKQAKEDGTYSKEKVQDKILSGFQCPIYSASEILITNAYERNMQKQRRIIKRRWVEKTELEAKYGEHENWIYVQEGMRSVYDDETRLFYDVKDDDHPTLVAEETLLGRREDAEICFLGGIYMGDANVDDNPIKHRDNHGAPKYNVVPFGYSRIGEHFFYYKSLMNSSKWDNDLYDAMSEIVMNRAILEIETPIAVSGSDDINSGIIFPNSIINLENPDSKVTKLLPEMDMAAGFNALRETEKSIDEGTVSPTASGQLPDSDQKAYSVAQAQAASRKLIGVAAKSLVESVCLIGDLMKDIFINHYTIPEVEELLGDKLKLKYKSFVVPNKPKGGKRYDKKIKFDPSYIGKEVTKPEREEMEMEHLEEVGYPNHKESMVMADPELFAKYIYLSRVDPEEIFTENSAYWQPILMNLMTAMSQNPFADMETLTRETMYAFFKSRGEDFVKKQPALQMSPIQSPELSTGISPEKVMP